MTPTTIRLRDDQSAFIAHVTKERAIDLSEFVRLCVDYSAAAVAQAIPQRINLADGRPVPKLVSLRTLKAERRKAGQKARAR